MSPGFANEEELGDAWHVVAGFREEVMACSCWIQGRKSRVAQNRQFSLRCSFSSQDIFFGPNDGEGTAVGFGGSDDHLIAASAAVRAGPVEHAKAE